MTNRFVRRACIACGLLIGCSSQNNGQNQGTVATGGTYGTPAAGATGGGTTAAGSGGTAAPATGGTPTGSGGASTAGAPTAGSSGMNGGATGIAGSSVGVGGSSGGAMGAAGAGGTSAAGASGSAGQGGSAGTATCNKDLTAQPGQDDCTAPLKPNDDRLCKMMIGGQMRQFYIYASPAFDPCKPASMIMDCHGLSESAEVHTGKQGFNLSGQMFPSGYGSGWRMAVQRDNAIVVTPQGLNNSWTPATDVPFLNKAADTVEAIADVDKAKEYVTGISMGGMMTVATGCDNANRWRGMAPVSMLQQGCTMLSKPTPVISFHSQTDMLTSYSADQTLMGNIAMMNHCKMGPTPSMVYGGANTLPDPVCYTMSNGVGAPNAPDPYHIPLQACKSSSPASTCVTYSQCDDGVEVIFCTVAASTQPLGGHILYNNDTMLDLAEVAWPFLKKFWK
jgi:poly(3-hydroxybutyrate) depolymerase